MGIAIPFNDKLYFILAKLMNLFKQLQIDSKVAISDCNGEKMLRLYATAVMDETEETADAFIGMVKE